MEGRTTNKRGIESMIGRVVELIFQDSPTQSSKREGRLLDQNNKFISIENRDGLPEFIPTSRIIRIKLIGGAR